MIPGSKRNTGGVRPTPAPAAAGIRNNQGIQAQARPEMTQRALQNKQGKPGNKPTGGVDPQNVPPKPPGWKPPVSANGGKPNKPKPKPKPKPDQKPKPTAPPAPTAPPVPAQPNPYETKPDPRDENYYANRAAIEATFAAEMAGLQAEEDRANVSFNEEGMLQAEYNRRRKRDMGLARLGSGSAYTGGARRDQLENDTDYMINETRRLRGKADMDAERELSRGRLTAQRDADIRELETSTAEQLANDMADEALNSSGDALPGDGIPPAAPPAGPGKPKPDATRQRLQGRIRNQTRRIKNMQEQLQKTKDPKKREQLQNRIEKEKKRRTQTKGKIKG